MTNKYQIALNCIKLTQVNFTDFGAFDLLQDFLPSDWIDTLQELIDNYNYISNEYSKAIECNAENLKALVKLEKALDYCYELLSHNPIRIDGKTYWKNKEKWKEFVRNETR